MCQSPCPNCNHPDIISRPIGLAEFLPDLADALTAPYHLVRVSPQRRVVVDIENILLGRPGECERPILEFVPRSERLPFWESAEAVLHMRATEEEPGAYASALDALGEVWRQTLPHVRFTTSQGTPSAGR